MKKILSFATLAAVMMLSMAGSAQSHKCGTMNHVERKMASDPDYKIRRELAENRIQDWIAANPRSKNAGGVVTIPVVVHVLYNAPAENVSTAQVQSQIDALNEDFRLLNADSLATSHPFWPYTADTEIEFCLATRDPNGNATTGITRTFTDSTTFVGDGNEKFTATGGMDNWDPTRYLNIWVCNLDGAGGLLGYAAFPDELATTPDEDGVVINFRAFGFIGTATAPNDLGRTGTHEVGHWLFLYHIWGDAFCGDDLVGDTETAEDPNYGCPTFPYNASNACGSGANGEMYMNYMDYVDDACMVMFTFGQGTRMHSAINTYRGALLTSQGCGVPANISSQAMEEELFQIYPNPNSGIFMLNSNAFEKGKVVATVFNALGAEIERFQDITSMPFVVDLSAEESGVYFIRVEVGGSVSSKKLILSK